MAHCLRPVARLARTYNAPGPPVRVRQPESRDGQTPLFKGLSLTRQSSAAVEFLLAHFAIARRPGSSALPIRARLTTPSDGHHANSRTIPVVIAPRALEFGTLNPVRPSDAHGQSKQNEDVERTEEETRPVDVFLLLYSIWSVSCARQR